MTEPIARKIVGKECRFAVYVPPPSNDKPDMHFVKEQVHYDDGTSEPSTRMMYGYEYDVYVTKPGARNHKSKKEWEDVDNLIPVKTTKADLVRNVCRALRMSWFQGDERKLFENPYIYGADIKSTAIIKKNEYVDKYKDCPKSLFSRGVLDIETDMYSDFNEILMVSFTYKDICFTAVTEKAVAGYVNVHQRVEELTNKHIGEHIKSRNIKPELVIVKTEIDLLYAVFEVIHKAKPDFLAIWNMDFEITNFIDAAERAGVSLADIMSDPEVPPEYRYFKYKQGKKQRLTASGKFTPIKPAAQWHTVLVPASFYVIDSMCAYKHTRMGKQELPSYSLENVALKELKFGKLDIDEAKNLSGPNWHLFMQKHYMLDYLVYNRFDCIVMEILDDKIKDLSAVLPGMAKYSDFEDFKSQPRRCVDDLHWEGLDKGRVIGTTSSTLVDEVDDETLGRDDWIITLKAALITEEGLRPILEVPNLNTRFYTLVADLDVSAS